MLSGLGRMNFVLFGRLMMMMMIYLFLAETFSDWKGSDFGCMIN